MRLMPSFVKQIIVGVKIAALPFVTAVMSKYLMLLNQKNEVSRLERLLHFEHSVLNKFGIDLCI